MAIFVLSIAFFHILAKVSAINDTAEISTHYEWLLVAKVWLDWNKAPNPIRQLAKIRKMIYEVEERFRYQHVAYCSVDEFKNDWHTICAWESLKGSWSHSMWKSTWYPTGLKTTGKD